MNETLVKAALDLLLTALNDKPVSDKPKRAYIRRVKTPVPLPAMLLNPRKRTRPPRRRPVKVPGSTVVSAE